ncbi:MAG: nucleotidyltransferase domain-containing protein [Anaerolineae bacterium]
MSSYPPEIQPVVNDCLPLCKALGEGRYAVSIGGSYGKGTFDRESDLDFRLFCERRSATPEARAELQAAIDRWRERDVTIDGCWVRTIDEIDRELVRWMDGTAQPTPMVWTIWGYYLPTDIYNQAVIEDPFGVVARWKTQLQTYPPKLKETLLEKHLGSMRYWREDYHYRHKVARRDPIFLSGLASRLVHDMAQVLFALNETYYVGDGNNLDFIRKFEHVPDGFGTRVEKALYPQTSDDRYEVQYQTLVELMDDVEELAHRLTDER